MDVRVYSPNRIHAWSYRDVFVRGIGGSETSAVEIAMRLAARGHNVYHYSDLPPDDPEFDPEFGGVHWRDLTDANLEDDGLWLVYRSPETGPLCKPAPGRVYYFVAEDVWYPTWTPENMAPFRRIFALCPDHRADMIRRDPSVADRVVLSSNGVNVEAIEAAEAEVGPGERNPKRLIWASSPDRGLKETLDIFERAREIVTDLELHVFYGLDNIAKVCGGNRHLPPWDKTWRQYERACAMPGVTWHGRIGQDALRREWFKSGIWLYPTWFCVTGDTLVDMPRDYSTHPRGVPIRELVGRSGFPVWCFDLEEERFKLAPVRWVKKTRVNAEVWRVEFDDGTFIRATPDHKFLLRNDLSWRRLRDLQPGDSCLHLAKHMQIQVGVKGTGRGGGWPTEHRIIAEYLTGGPLAKGMHVDHIDGNPWNNSPDNLRVMTASEHARKTFSGRVGMPSGRRASGDILRRAHAARTPEERSEWGRKAGKAFWDSMSPEERAAFIARREVNRKPAAAAALQRKWEEATDEERADWTAGLALGPQANAEAHKRRQEQFQNHKVVRVCPDGLEDVYDLLVDGPHNFVANGVVVHNSETSCIACMEAQACGAIPITRPFWAVGWNVRHGGVFVEGDPNEPLIKARYVAALVAIASDPDGQEAIRARMMPRARVDFDWDRWAEQWELLGLVDMGEVERMGLEATAEVPA